jgi:hypothetical protein
MEGGTMSCTVSAESLVGELNNKRAISPLAGKLAPKEMLGKLRWTVPPARLTKYADNDKQRNQTTAKHEQDEFEARARKAEADKVKAKEQEAAGKQAREIIAGILFDDGRGRIDFTKTERVKSNASAHLDKAIKGGRDLKQALKEIITYRDKEYAAVEVARERVG